MPQFPSVTIFTGTFNPNLQFFEKMLRAIKRQQYPQKIQHIIYDACSTNGAIGLAKSYGCKVLSFKNTKDEGSMRLYRSLSYAKGEVSIFIESDNILTSKEWIARLVEPLQEKNVFATYPAWNDFLANSDPITRYFALIGSPDPTLYYLSKSDKIPVIQKRYNKGEIIKETNRYWVVRFNSDNLPTMGDNGFLVLTAVLRSVVLKNKPFFHVDGYFELLKMGYDTYGVVKNSIIHLSRPNILDQVRRRVAVKRAFTDEKLGKRIYHVMDWSSPRDRWNLFKYIVFSLTFIQPILVSIRGYLKIRDTAWFLHPVMCFLMVVAYGWSEIVFQTKRGIPRLMFRVHSKIS